MRYHLLPSRDAPLLETSCYTVYFEHRSERAAG